MTVAPRLVRVLPPRVLPARRVRQRHAVLAAVFRALIDGVEFFGHRAWRTRKRHALHAAELGFVHPTTGQWLEFRSPLPDEIAHVLSHLREHFLP